MISANIALIRHELGHWIVAKEYGFNPKYIEINAYGGYLYSSPKPNITNFDELKVYLFKRITCLYGGLVSELLEFNYESKEFSIDMNKFEEKIETTAKDDFSKIQELILIYRGFIRVKESDIQEEINSFSNTCYFEAQKLIEDNYFLIQKSIKTIVSIYENSSKNSLRFEYKNSQWQVLDSLEKQIK